MTEYRFRNITDALPTLMDVVLSTGEEMGSRAGRVQEILYPHIVLTEPWNREILHPLRKASLPAQIAETMWVLAGRDDVEFLEAYLPRAAEFSDDGKRWRGAYGKRLRGWPFRDGSDVFDQLAWVVDLLKQEPGTRRAVLAIYDPEVDSTDGKDIPCNNWIHFLSRLGKLHMHVTIRSNDLMWGWSGINAFEWSALQEIVAGLVGQDIGELHFSISSLHLYDRHWKKASGIAANPKAIIPFPGGSPRFSADTFERDLRVLDIWMDDWFRIEDQMRSGNIDDVLRSEIDSFAEPMLRSWLQVLAWWWTDDEAFLEPLLGMPIHFAAILSPRTKSDPIERPSVPAPKCPTCDSPDPARHPAVQFEGEVSICSDNWHSPTPDVGACGFKGNFPHTPGLCAASRWCRADPFVYYVANLHAEKHAIYGDSWKKRGEPGILGNIARKVDRIGQGGAGDTATDTVIDLLVYLVKYRLWLTDERSAPSPVDGAYRWLLSDMEEPVTEMLQKAPGNPAYHVDIPKHLENLKAYFSQLEIQVRGIAGTHINEAIIEIVETMIREASFVARRLWLDDQHPEGAAMSRFFAVGGGGGGHSVIGDADGYGTAGDGSLGHA